MGGAARFQIAGLAALALVTSAGSGHPPGTIEDVYGDSGQFFKAAIALRSDEKDSPDEPDPATSFGLAIDDVLLMWREFALIADPWDCPSTGSCAVLDVQSANFYEGRASVQISLLELSPDVANDCDLDAAIEPNEDRDCDDDGTLDLVVRATSLAEPSGEIVLLERVGTSSEYRGEVPISSRLDVQGILFVTALGEPSTTVVVTYIDHDDGTGQPCRNDVDSDHWGEITSASEVFLTAGSVTVADAFGAVLTDNGDGDGYPDTNETVSLTLSVRNLGTTDLHGVSARLVSSSPYIDCILDGDSFVGDLPAGATRSAVDPFVFKIAAVDRTALGLDTLDSLVASVSVTLTADEFDVATSPQPIELDLDLDFAGGSGPTTYFESFEVPQGLSSFTTMNLDAGRHHQSGSDGFHCQYSTCDFECFECILGGTTADADRYHWQINDPADIDGGRAFTGTNSLYMGVFGPTINTHTTPTGTLEAAGTAAPINLGFAGNAPGLSFKHQISLVNHRGVSARGGRTADKGVVQLQLADLSGAPIGDWIKIQPYVNVYDLQGEDNFFNCSFDPIDDGNDEYDVTSEPPQSIRPYGPSSTCYPEFVFSYLGDTFAPFSPSRIGNAQGPGLEGSTGPGTWVESRISLFRFRGRRVRLRFLTSGLSIPGVETWEQIFSFNPDPDDDGWWIDDVMVTNALTTPAVVSNDDKQLALPGCGATCNTVTAVLESIPPEVPAPGQVFTVAATDSSADRCLDGALLFRFCVSADDDCADPQDTILRAFTDNPIVIDAPSATTHYAVDVRCSSDPSCQASTGLTVQVLCPGTVQAIPTVRAPDRLMLSWGEPRPFDVARGVLDADRVELATYAENLYLANRPAAVSYSIAADLPAGGTGYWYLFRPPGSLGSGSGLCNDPLRTWGQASRDAALP